MVLLALLCVSAGTPFESINYLRDTSGTLTIDEIKNTTFSTTTSDNLGTENGTYWFKIDGITADREILELKSSHVNNLELYDSSGKELSIMKDTRFPSYFLVKRNLEFPIYLKANFPVEAYFPIHHSDESSFASKEKRSLLSIGFFYGTAIALIVAILIFYFIVRNTQFLFFAFLVLAVLLSILTKDNVLYLFGITNNISISLEIFGHYLVGISATGFMMFYLKVRPHQMWIKYAMLAMSTLSTIFLITYLISQNIIGFIGVDITCIATVVLMWILMLMIAKGARKLILIGVYSINILFLADYFLLHIVNLSFIHYTPAQVAVAASFNFTLIAILLLVSFKDIQKKGVLMKQKLMFHVQELKELSAYKNVQDADDSYMESLIYQYKLENMEVRILNDISKGLSNEMIALKHGLSDDKLQQLTSSLYSKLGLDDGTDLQELSF